MTTYLGKSCSFGLPRVPFVNCGQFMYLVISLLVLRAGCGIWLYQFLIIAYLFTLHIRGAFWLVSSRGYNTSRGCIWMYDPTHRSAKYLWIVNRETRTMFWFFTRKLKEKDQKHLYRNQHVWCKFHANRTINKKVIEDWRFIKKKTNK